MTEKPQNLINKSSKNHFIRQKKPHTHASSHAKILIIITHVVSTANDDKIIKFSWLKNREICICRKVWYKEFIYVNSECVCEG